MPTLKELRAMIDEITEGTWQKLLTKKDLNKLPKLYATEKDKDPMVWVKFFNPYGRGTWFATEYDPEQEMFFGYVMGLGGDELGYFSLADLKRIRAEREQYWKPMRLSAAKAYEKKLHGYSEGKEGDPEDGKEIAEGVITLSMLKAAAAKADDAVTEAYLAVEKLKSQIDTAEEIPDYLKKMYDRTVKALGKLAELKKDTYQTRMEMRKVR